MARLLRRRRLFRRRNVLRLAACEGLEGRLLLSIAPTVTTGAALSVSTTGATLNATVNPQGLATNARFQYSTDPTFMPTASATVGSGFSGPTGVAMDGAGDVFVADWGNNAVKEVLVSGTTQTYASGFNRTQGVAVDAAGDVFAIDGTSTITKILPGGTRQTIPSGIGVMRGIAADAAGDVFVTNYSWNASVKEIFPDGTSKLVGQGLNDAWGVAVDVAGNVFVGEQGNNDVKEVLTNGIVNVIASGLNSPEGVAVDAVGDVFVADSHNNAVKEILPSGTVRALGGGFNGEQGVAVDAAGNVFVADTGNNRAVELSPPTIAATPSPVSGSIATAVSAALSGLTPDTLYYDRAVATSAGGTVAASASSFLTLPAPTVVTGAATSISTAGATLNATVNPQGSTTAARFQYSTDPSFAPTSATTIGSQLSNPDGVAVDAAGDVFVADSGNNAVTEVLPNGSIQPIGLGFSFPTSVAVDAAGDVFVADYGHGVVKEVLPTGTILTLGTGFSSPRGVAVDAAGDVFVADDSKSFVTEILPNGTLRAVGSGFAQPFGVAVDLAGDVFVADLSNNAVKEVLPGGTIMTLGLGFSLPIAVAVDATGDVFVSDYGHNAIKEIPFNGTTKTLSSGSSYARGVAVDAAGDVFVADGGNNRIVELSPPTVAATPSPLTGSIASAVSGTLTGLSPGTTYYYRAVAASAGGTIADSSVQSFTTTAISSLAVSSATGTYGGTSTLSATLTAGGGGVSGKTIAFTLNGASVGFAVTNSSGVATFSGASLAGIAVGNYPTAVGASFAGDTSDTASSGSNSLAVDELPSTVVTTLSDVVNPTDGLISLREAIGYAQAGDTITFAHSLTSGGATITLGGTELLIDKNLTIDGPGANLLTVSGDYASRVFEITAGTVAMDGFTIAQGNAANGGGIFLNSTLNLSHMVIDSNSSGGKGGGIYDHQGSLTITDSTIGENSCATLGGGVVAYAGPLSLTNCVISGNSAAGGTSGGGVVGQENVSTITDCTFINNSASGDGGAILNETLDPETGMTITGSTFTSNSAQNHGGAIMNEGTLAVSDSTFTGNSVLQDGGAIANDSSGTLTLNNSTLNGNIGHNSGGAVYNESAGSVTVNSSIISGNLVGYDWNDVAGTLDPSSSYNLIGIGADSLAGTNNNIVGVTNPMLSGLGDYGGPTQTTMPLPGSPALDAGNDFGLATDQRGFNRIVNGQSDIGAVESRGFVLTATGGDNQVAPISTGFADPLQVTVTSKFDEPVDGGSVTFTAPSTGASATISGSPATIVGGIAQVNASANAVGGAYKVRATVGANAPAVFNLENHEVPSTVVTTLSDAVDPTDGLISLREAIGYAQAGDTITFAPSLTSNGPATITLDGTELLINKNLTIDGPGASLLSISGNDASRDFEVTSGTVGIDGLTVTGGLASDNGGGICNNGGTLTLSNLDVSGNSADSRGGGVYNDSGDSAITLADCIVSHNSANNSNLDIIAGGGIFNGGTMTLTHSTVSNSSVNALGWGGGIGNVGALNATNCTISDNSADVGAGIHNHKGTGIGLLTLTDCTISGNTATSFGGGLFNRVQATATVTDSTISGNSAGDDGGGVMNDYQSTMTLIGSTISGNSASNAAGIANASGSVTVAQNSIVAGNSGTADISGNNLDSASSFNLIGVGGGLTNGVNGNIVGVTDPLLAPLGDYGGPTQTMTPLPGSPALDAGNDFGLTTDQRGFNRVVNGQSDIGAVESRGFVLTATGGDNQVARISTGFADPLQVTVTSPFGEPVDGGSVTFTAPSSGASATVSGSPATISGGIAQVTASANTVGGAYQVSATVGANAPAIFNLENHAAPTVNVIDAGGIYDTNPFPASGDVIGADGENLGTPTFKYFEGSTALDHAPVNAGNYTVIGSFAGNSSYPAGSASIAMTINKANAIVVVTPYNATYDANPHTASYTIAGVGTDTVAAGSSVTLNTTHTNAGNYSADSWSFSGGNNYNDIASTTITDSIGKASSTTTTISAGPFTYDSTTHVGGSGTVTGAGGLSASASSLTYTGDQVDAGTYYVTAHYAGDANHFASDGAAVATAINKAPSSTITLGAGPFAYDTTTHAGGSGTVTGAGGLSVSASSLTYTGDQVDAGTYFVTAHYAGDANHFASDGAAVGIVINKASSATTTLGAGPFTYDSTTHTGGSGTVTGAGGLSTSASSLTYSGDQVDAGTYYVTAHYAGDANHLASDGVAVAITISKADATVVVSPYNVTYDANPHTASYTVTGVGTDTSAAGGSVTLNTIHTNAGTYSADSWSFSGGKNYNDITSTTITDAIGKASSTTMTFGAGPFTYDSTTHTGGSGTVTGAGGLSASASSLTYSGDQVDAGTYYVTAHYAGDANHLASDGAGVAITINKANATVVVSPYNVTYDANPHTASYTITGVGTDTAVAGGSVTLDTTHTNAGTYSADSWSFSGGTNYNDIASTNITDSIGKASSTTTTFGAGPFTYDSTTHTGGSGTVTGAGGLSTSASSLTYSGDQVDAGTYYVTAHYAGDANHFASDGAAVGIVINKASSSTTTLGAGPFTYDATTHTGGSGTVTGAGSLSASASSLTYSGDQVDAGTYFVTAHYAGDANHLASDGAAVGVVINKASSSTTTLGAGPFTYDSTTHAGGSGTVTGAGGLSASASSLTYSGDQIDAGTYFVTAHYAGDANHFASDGAAMGIVINKASSSTTTLGAGPFTYDATTHTGGSGSVTGAGGLSTGASSLTYSDDQVDAGTYYVTAHYAGDANHLASDGAGVAITINKANATVVVTPYNATYDGNPHTATYTVTGVGIDTSAAGSSVTLDTTHTNAGIYSADSWSFSGGNNYNDIASTSITDSIGKASSTTTTFGAGPFTYDSTTHTGGSGTVTGAGGLSTSASSLTYGGDQVDAGTYYVTAHYAGDANHFGSDGAAVAITINKANAIVVVSPYNVTYDANPHTASCTITGVGTDTAAAGGSVTLDTTHTNAGTYSADSWSFSGGNNYNDIASTGITDTIGKAGALVVVTRYNLIYDANPHTAAGSATGVGSVNLSGDLNLSGTTHTNAGTYAADAWFFHDPNGNYQDSGGTITDSIGQATATVGVSDGGGTYTGAAFPATSATATGVGGLNDTNLADFTFAYAGTGTTSYGPSTSAPANAGTYTVTASYIGDANHMESSSLATPFTIGQAGSMTIVIDAGGTYNGVAFPATSATATGAGGLNDTTFADFTFSYAGTGSTSYGPSTSAPANAGTYTVTASYVGDANHVGSSSAIPFTIGQTGSITLVADGGGTYTGAAFPVTSAAATGAGGLSDTNLADFTFVYEGTGSTTYGPSISAPADAGNYIVTATYVGDANHIGSSSATAFTIGQAGSMTIVADAGGTYNGTAFPATSATATGAGGFSDTTLADFTLSYAGTGTTSYGPSPSAPVNAGSYTVTATNIGDANHTGSSSSTTFAISKATLMAIVTVSDKAYDGSKSATIAMRALSGLENGDSVALAGGAASFADKNVGIGKTVTVSGLSLSGPGASNYTMASSSLTTNASITRRTLVVTVSGVGKIYDGNTKATVILSDNRVGGDVLVISYTAAFADKNAGTNKTVNVTGIALSGADAGNYITASSLTTSATIALKAITGTVHVANKVYDGTTNGTITGGSFAGVVAGDIVGFGAGNAKFSDNNVGTNKKVTVSGLTLGGAAASNYVLINPTETTTANITARSLVVTANNFTRVYGQANPVFSGTLGGLIAADGISFSGTTSATQSSRAGTYSIVPTLKDPNHRLSNYAVTTVKGTLTVLHANTTTFASSVVAKHGTGTVTLTADVLANSPSTAIVGDGTVTFFIVNKYGAHLKTVSSGTTTNGVATAKLSLSGLVVGSYMIVAVFVPNASKADFNTSITEDPGKLTVT